MARAKIPASSLRTMRCCLSCFGGMAIEGGRIPGKFTERDLCVDASLSMLDNDVVHPPCYPGVDAASEVISTGTLGESNFVLQLESTIAPHRNSIATRAYSFGSTFRMDDDLLTAAKVVFEPETRSCRLYLYPICTRNSATLCDASCGSEPRHPSITTDLQR